MFIAIEPLSQLPGNVNQAMFCWSALQNITTKVSILARIVGLDYAIVNKLIIIRPQGYMVKPRKARLASIANPVLQWNLTVTVYQLDSTFYCIFQLSLVVQ